MDQFADRLGAPDARAERFGPVEVYFGDEGGKYPHANFAVVSGRDGRAIIDLPLVSRQFPEILARADLVLLTHVHEDHVAGLSLVPNTPVHVHRDDIEAIQSIEGYAAHLGYGPKATAASCDLARDKFHYVARPDALSFQDGASWDLGGVTIAALHTPGHTAGHCVFRIEPSNIAVIGDIDLSTFGPYYGDAVSSLSLTRSSIDMLSKVPARCWITSHHKGVITHPDKFHELLRKYRDALSRRESAILNVLREGSQTLEDLVRRRFVYPKHYVGIHVEDVERRMIAQHLDELERDGRLLCASGSYLAR